MARNRKKNHQELAPLWEYPLRHFGFADDTPMATVIGVLREPVLRAILEVRYALANSRNLTDAVDCTNFFVGYSQERRQGRSRVRVQYRLVQVSQLSNGEQVRKLSRSRTVSAWIGKGSAGGVSLYWREPRPAETE